MGFILQVLFYKVDKVKWAAAILAKATSGQFSEDR